MKVYHQDISITLFLLGMGIFLYVVSLKVQTSTEGSFSSPSSSWIHRLLSNLSGYAIIFLPGYLIIKYIYRVNYIDKAHKGFLWPLIRACVYGQDGLGGEMLLPSSDPSLSKSAAVDSNSDLSFKKNAALLVYCFGGLQASYLMWGLLQEKIMTQSYSGQQFTDSQFLVFVNRILALVIAWVYLGIYERPTIASLRQRRGDAPLYKYSYCAFSNIMSSWFQYEALKFVSFPTQVLAKACKIIPVMLMGKLVSRQTYEYYEYVTASLISFGMVLFLSGSGDSLKVTESTGASSVGMSGVVVLVLYMVFDSFTSNWQSALFKTYKVSSVRMMAGVNLFACLLTGISLFQQGTLFHSTDFMFQHTSFAFDCLILSICSAVGQLFIYFTIEKFGPVVFIIIMTIRQALAVLLSCIFYQHPMSAIGIVGVLVVFLSVMLRTYCAYRLKQIRGRKRPSTASLSSLTSNSLSSSSSGNITKV